MASIINPKTGKKIKVGGPTYQKLMQSKWVDMITDIETAAVRSPKRSPKKSPKRSPKQSPKKGCSNQGKYKGVSADLFCGTEGGSCPGTYPVNTKGRARAALAYARHAPNPEGIKKCVRRLWPDLGKSH